MNGDVTRLFDLLKLYRSKCSAKKDVFTFSRKGEWKTFSASDYVDYSNWVSSGLLALGLQKGDKVATIINNCPAWNYFDMGIMQIGGVHVPVYPTLSSENFLHIFTHSEIRFLFISSQSIYERVRPLLPRVKTLEAVYSIDKIEGVPHWKEFLILGQTQFDIKKIDLISTGIQSDDLATIIYTSGTTGKGKGVMLSHRNFISNFKATAEIVEPKNISRSMSFLPLCHVYERMLNYMYQYLGINICYIESFDKVMEGLRQLQPEMMCAVPRVLEKMHNGFIARGRALRQPLKSIYFWALSLASRYTLDARPLGYRIQLMIADRLVFRKWRKAVGGRLRFIVSGGASLNPKIARVFWAANLQVMEGYGLTETSPVIAVSNFEPGGVKFGTVGPPLKGVEIKLSGDGEILCRGPNVMLGYYKEPLLTSQVIDAHGWLHTGDIGELVDGRYLRITDRKKEMFKTSGGKYIAPQAIENRCKESDFIENIMVIGENKHFAAALIVPNFEHIRGWYASKGHAFSSPSAAIRDPILLERIQREIDLINESLDKPEQIKAFRLLDTTWSPDTGELSLTLKLRRKEIEHKNRALIYDMYDAR